MTFVFFAPLSRAGKEPISVGLRTGVSGGIGATNACTRMYRLDFIVEHEMRSDKACRAALSRERMAVYPPKSVHFQEAVRPHDGAAFSLVTSFGKAK